MAFQDFINKGDYVGAMNELINQSRQIQAPDIAKAQQRGKALVDQSYGARGLVNTGLYTAGLKDFADQEAARAAAIAAQNEQQAYAQISPFLAAAMNRRWQLEDQARAEAEARRNRKRGIIGQIAGFAGMALGNAMAPGLGTAAAVSSGTGASSAARGAGMDIANSMRRYNPDTGDFPYSGNYYG